MGLPQSLSGPAAGRWYRNSTFIRGLVVLGTFRVLHWQYRYRFITVSLRPSSMTSH